MLIITVAPVVEKRQEVGGNYLPVEAGLLTERSKGFVLLRVSWRHFILNSNRELPHATKSALSTPRLMVCCPVHRWPTHAR
jgi:hypothetical protein